MYEPPSFNQGQVNNSSNIQQPQFHQELTNPNYSQESQRYSYYQPNNYNPFDSRLDSSSRQSNLPALQRSAIASQQYNKGVQQQLDNNNSRINKVSEQNSILNAIAQVQKESKSSLLSCCCGWLHVGMVCIHAIGAVVVLAILVYYFPLSSDLEIQLNQLTDNWELEAISAVEVVISSTSSCSSGFEYFFTFQGLSTVSGCNCLSSSYSTKTVISGSCTSEMISSGCQNIPSLSGAHGSYWRMSGFPIVDFTICVKRIPGLTYSSYGSKTTCDKQCGGSTDSTKFCVDTTQSCPINYMAILLTSTSVNGASSIPIGGSTYSLFYSTVDTSSLPIVEARITQGGGVCLNNAIQNLSSSQTGYVLLDSSQSHVCSSTDSRFSAIISADEYSLLSANGILSLYKQLPDYIISTNENYNLYFRAYIPLAADQRTSANIDDIEEINARVKQVKVVSEVMLITASVYLFFVGIICNIYSILVLLNRQSKFAQLLQKSEQSEEISRKSSFFKRLLAKVTHAYINTEVLELIFSFIDVSAMTVGFALALNTDQMISRINSGIIGDAYSVSLFSGLHNEFRSKIFWYILGCSISIWVIIILEICALVPLCSRKLQESNKDIKISKKYIPEEYQIQQKRAKIENEMQEFQINNMYGGGGINTTVSPFVDQMGGIGGGDESKRIQQQNMQVYQGSISGKNSSRLQQISNNSPFYGSSAHNNQQYTQRGLFEKNQMVQQSYYKQNQETPTPDDSNFFSPSTTNQQNINNDIKLLKQLKSHQSQQQGIQLPRQQTQREQNLQYGQEHNTQIEQGIEKESQGNHDKAIIQYISNVYESASSN